MPHAVKRYAEARSRIAPERGQPIHIIHVRGDRMKIALAIVLASVLFASCSKHPWNVVLEPGEYLHEQYIQRLRDTRSPLKAGKGGGRLSYQVRSDKGIVSISGNESFHEGAESFSFRILSDGSVRFVEPPDAQHSPVITVLNTRSFNIAWPKGPRTESSPLYVEGGKYDWVGEDAEMWVMRQILVGQYRTPDGFDVSLDPDVEVISSITA